MTEIPEDFTVLSDSFFVLVDVDVSHSFKYYFTVLAVVVL